MGLFNSTASCCDALSLAPAQGKLDHYPQGQHCSVKLFLAVGQAELEREGVRLQLAQAREEIKKLGAELGAASEEDLDYEVAPPTKTKTAVTFTITEACTIGLSDSGLPILSTMTSLLISQNFARIQSGE